MCVNADVYNVTCEKKKTQGNDIIDTSDGNDAKPEFTW
jgi:hypothetical protein